MSRCVLHQCPSPRESNVRRFQHCCRSQGLNEFRLNETAARQAQQQGVAGPSGVQIDPETVAKRTKRRLEELEVGDRASSIRFNTHREMSCQKSNYAEPRESLTGALEGEEISGRPTDRSRETISLRNDGKQRKRSTAAVRAILLYRKNFNTLLEEAVCQLAIPAIRGIIDQALDHNAGPGRRPRAQLSHCRSTATEAPSTNFLSSMWILGLIHLPKMRATLLFHPLSRHT